MDILDTIVKLMVKILGTEKVARHPVLGGVSAAAVLDLSVWD